MTQPVPFRPADLVAIVVVVVFWGLIFVVMKVGLAYFTPFQLGAGRFAFAFLPLALRIPIPRVRRRWLVAFGLAQGVGQFGFLFVALHLGMTAALASVLLQTQVFFTAGLGVVLLGERIGAPLRLGFGFAAAGLACFATNAAATQAGSGVGGAALALTLASAAMWATSNIVVRKAQREGGGFHPVGFVVWSSAVAILPFLLMSWWLDPPQAQGNWARAPWQGWLALAALGWLATSLAYGLWTGLLKRYPASRVAPFSLGVPLIGLAAGIALLGEVVTPLQWAGAFLVFCALGCVLFGDRLLRARAVRA